MGTPLGPKYIPYTYMDPVGKNHKRDNGNSIRAPVYPQYAGNRA